MEETKEKEIKSKINSAMAFLGLICFLGGLLIGYHFGYDQRKQEDEEAWKVIEKQVKEISFEIDVITSDLKNKNQSFTEIERK